MSIAKGGFKCDVCGKMIFLLPGQLLKPLKIVGIDRLLHIHNKSEEHKCYDQLKLAGQRKDYRLLPNGPLKELYWQEIQLEKKDKNVIIS